LHSGAIPSKLHPYCVFQLSQPLRLAHFQTAVLGVKAGERLSCLPQKKQNEEQKQDSGAGRPCPNENGNSDGLTAKILKPFGATFPCSVSM